MNDKLKKSLKHWVEQHLVTEFLEKRAARVDELTLADLVHRKNPYLFMCKGHSSAREVVDSFVHAYLSSSEETLFGNFLQKMALHVCKSCVDGKKHPTPGLILDFVKDGKRYLVSVKSSPRWGNSEAKKQMARRLRDAKKREMAKAATARANGPEHEIVTVIGCMYGESPQEDQEHHKVLAGKDFWELISGRPDLYMEIVVPLRTVASAHKKDIQGRIGKVTKKLSAQFRKQFRKANGEIDWEEVVKHNSMRSWTR